MKCTTYWRHTVNVRFDILSNDEEPPTAKDIQVFLADHIADGEYEIDTTPEYDPEGDAEAHMEAMGWPV